MEGEPRRGQKPKEGTDAVDWQRPVASRTRRRSKALKAQGNLRVGNHRRVQRKKGRDAHDRQRTSRERGQSPLAGWPLETEPVSSVRSEAEGARKRGGWSRDRSRRRRRCRTVAGGQPLVHRGACAHRAARPAKVGPAGSNHPTEQHGAAGGVHHGNVVVGCSDVPEAKAEPEGARVPAERTPTVEHRACGSHRMLLETPGRQTDRREAERLPTRSKPSKGETPQEARREEAKAEAH